jgi:exodeoxyribonuclease-1
MESFFWFDFETFGANPVKDRASQFAGIRTDLDFNIIDEPINIYCKPADDFIPDPEACLVTGITPQEALEKGVCEKEFFRQIHLELTTPRTCALGYNNIRFDDEVIRFGFYRNFYDAYAREWQGGNSRWDLIDLMRMTYALRPEGINWPKDDEGQPTFRLEKLSIANNIVHENAHDALADVYATIGMAKLIKEKQPKLFNYLFELRDKRRVMSEIDLINHKPFIHSSGMLGGQHAYCGVMLPLLAHPRNKNSTICLDLSKPFDGLEKLNVDEIKTRMFTRQDDLPEGVSRLPIKEIHANKCPAVAPLGVLNQSVQKRLDLNLKDCLNKADHLMPALSKLQSKLEVIYQDNNFSPITNPDHALYSGGFFSNSDKDKMEQIRMSNWDDLAESIFNFDDKRLSTLLYRYRARNAPESLTEQEKQDWQAFKQDNFFNSENDSSLTYEVFKEKLEQLKLDDNNNQSILNQVETYVEKLVKLS